ncbi:MAG: hypothetical protein JWR46_2926, partial [Mycobacterium sp.]|nr:hypothetical protein [Mycobacterium sp.]
LLIVAALGIAAYGVYGFIRSRYADMGAAITRTRG